MNLQLEGKRALVTGSTSGIGTAIAMAISREGARVAIHGRDATRAAAVARRIEDAGGSAVICLGDLGSDAGAEEVGHAAFEQLGGVDILVNNAGAYQSRSWMELAPQDWAESYNANVLSAVRLIQLVVPRMQASGWGRIVQISSRLAIRPREAMPDYAAGKAALLNLTISLAKSVASWGITVNAVSAGIVLTPAVEEYFRTLANERGWGPHWPDIEREIMRAWSYDPAVRLARPDDVAHLVAFLASPLAGAISGSNFRVDGGGTGTVS